MRVDLRTLLPALGLAAFPVGALAQDAYDCTTLSVCEGTAPCVDVDSPLRLVLERFRARVTDAEGREIVLDRSLTRNARGPDRAFAATTPGNTSLLLSFMGESGGLTITEHTRGDVAAPGAVTLTAICRPEGG
jgi:hypothetical protein